MKVKPGKRGPHTHERTVDTQWMLRDRLSALHRTHWVLASAIDGRADLLVTWDQDLLAIANQAPLPIVDPRGCWDRLRQ